MLWRELTMKRLLLLSVGMWHTSNMPMQRSVSLSFSRQQELTSQRHADYMWQMQRQQAFAAQQQQILLFQQAVTLSLSQSRPKVEEAVKKNIEERRTISQSASLERPDSGGNSRPSIADETAVQVAQEARQLESTVIDGSRSLLERKKIHFWRNILPEQFDGTIRTVKRGLSNSSNSLNVVSLHGKDTSKVEVAGFMAQEWGFQWYQLRKNNDFNSLGFILKKIARNNQPGFIIIDQLDSMNDTDSRKLFEIMRQLKQKWGQPQVVFALVSKNKLNDKILHECQPIDFELSAPSERERENYISSALCENRLRCDNETITERGIVFMTSHMSYAEIHEYVTAGFERVLRGNTGGIVLKGHLTGNSWDYEKKAEEPVPQQSKIPQREEKHIQPACSWRTWTMVGVAAVAVVGGCYWFYNKFFRA